MAKKIKVGFDDAELGTIEVGADGLLTSDNGPLLDMARHYALLAHDLAEDAGKDPEKEVTGEGILELMLGRVRGRTWTEEVKDEGTDPAEDSRPSPGKPEPAGAAA